MRPARSQSAGRDRDARRVATATTATVVGGGDSHDGAHHGGNPQDDPAKAGAGCCCRGGSSWGTEGQRTHGHKGIAGAGLNDAQGRGCRGRDRSRRRLPEATHRRGRCVEPAITHAGEVNHPGAARWDRLAGLHNQLGAGPGELNLLGIRGLYGLDSAQRAVLAALKNANRTPDALGAAAELNDEAIGGIGLSDRLGNDDLIHLGNRHRLYGYGRQRRGGKHESNSKRS